MSVDASSVHVNLGERSYEIRIVSEGLAELPTLLPSWLDRSVYRAGSSRLAHIVTDRNVRRHADVVRESLTRAGWNCGLSELEPGEKTKTVANLSTIWDALIAAKADRRTVIVAVGGGVIGDLAGFAAASFVRGLPFVQVPTSLLADVDSSVGGKTGINHPAAKNMLGAFHQPVGVLIDTTVLDTLPAREFSAGLAEVVKYGVILDADFFSFLEQRAESVHRREPSILRQVVARCCRLKADVVEKDEFERTGLRAVLNYGHTFGHAFEALAGYGELLHGEAVAIGMLYASRLAERLGFIDAATTRRQEVLLSLFGLPTRLPTGWPHSEDAVIDRMKLDKKTLGGQLRFVLPKELGHVEVVSDVNEADVRAVLRGE
ncbi:MAG: 3-dehydroquinate synthase [Planctomycetota bacterium]|nr:MAG: 3-dehydroquinate synthase [Planctomycetota bacterium]